MKGCDIVFVFRLIIGFLFIIGAFVEDLSGPALFFALLIGFYFLGSAIEAVDKKKLRDEQLKYFTRANQNSETITTDTEKMETKNNIRAH